MIAERNDTYGYIQMQNYTSSNDTKFCLRVDVHFVRYGTYRCCLIRIDTECKFACDFATLRLIGIL